MSESLGKLISSADSHAKDICIDLIDGMSFGRGSASKVRFSDSRLSGVHFKIAVRDGIVYIEDSSCLFFYFIDLIF